MHEIIENNNNIVIKKFDSKLIKERYRISFAMKVDTMVAQKKLFIPENT